MYDPTVGRFLEKDPTGYLGKDTNLYRYVGNSPTNGTDPTGLVFDWGDDYGGLPITTDRTLSVAFTGDLVIDLAAGFQNKANDDQILISPGDSWQTILARLDQLLAWMEKNSYHFGDVTFSGHGKIACMLGTATLEINMASLQVNGSDQYTFLKKIGDHMKANAEVYVYCCHVAGVDRGDA